MIQNGRGFRGRTRNINNVQGRIICIVSSHRVLCRWVPESQVKTKKADTEKPSAEETSLYT